MRESGEGARDRPQSSEGSCALSPSHSEAEVLRFGGRNVALIFQGAWGKMRAKEGRKSSSLPPRSRSRTRPKGHLSFRIRVPVVCEPVFRVSERERAKRAIEGGFAERGSAQNRPKSGVNKQTKIINKALSESVIQSERCSPLWGRVWGYGFKRLPSRNEFERCPIRSSPESFRGCRAGLLAKAFGVALAKADRYPTLSLAVEF